MIVGNLIAQIQEITTFDAITVYSLLNHLISKETVDKITTKFLWPEKPQERQFSHRKAFATSN